MLLFVLLQVFLSVILVISPKVSAVSALSIDQRFSNIEQRVSNIEQRVSNIEITMYTKADAEKTRAEMKADMANLNFENRLFSSATMGVSLVVPGLMYTRLKEIDAKDAKKKEDKRLIRKRSLKEDFSSFLDYFRS
jgi:ribosomal protein L14E/L6E/L27E